MKFAVFMVASSLSNRLGDSANCMTLANYLTPPCLIILTCNIGKVIVPNA